MQKLVSELVLKTYNTIKSTGIPIKLEENEEKLIEEVKRKNKNNYEKIKITIELYIELSKSKYKKRFEKNILWEIANKKNALKIIQYVTKNSIELLEIFEDTKDIIRIGRRVSSNETLEIIKNRHYREKLNKRVGSINLVKIASNDCAHNVLMTITDDRSWKKLEERLGKKGIIKISNHNGSFKILQTILDNTKWQKLRELLDVEEIIKISGLSGGLQILNLILTDDRLEELKKILKENEWLKILCHHGSMSVIEILMKPENWKKLNKRLNKELIVKIAGNHSTSYILEIILDDKKWEELNEKIGYMAFIKIAMRRGARHTLEFLLNKDNWERLISNHEKEEIIKVAKNEGAKSVLEILIDKDKWSKLMNEVGKENAKEIASKGGSINTLEIILKKESWEKIKKRIGFNNAIIIAKQHGGYRILEIIKNDHKWETLSNRIKNKTLRKIATQVKGENILRIYLDDKKWNIIKKRIEEKELDELIGHKNSSKIIMDILNDKKWHKLMERIDKEDLIEITKHVDSLEIIETILENQSWEKIKKRIHKKHLKEIIKNGNSNKLLYVVINDEKWKKTVLLIRLIEDKPIEQISEALIIRTLKVQIEKKDNEETYDHKNNTNEENDNEKKLIKGYQFDPKEAKWIKSTAKNFLGYILDLTINQKEALENVFDGFGIPLMKGQEIKIKQDESENIDNEKEWIKTLAQLNKHCKNTPLSIEELHYLKIDQPSNLSEKQRLKRLTDGLEILGEFDNPERIELWRKITKNKWIEKRVWIERLKNITKEKKRWLIKNGITELKNKIVKDIEIRDFDEKEQKEIIGNIKIRTIREVIKENFVLEFEEEKLENLEFNEIEQHTTEIKRKNKEGMKKIEWLLIAIKTYDFLDQTLYWEKQIKYPEIIYKDHHIKIEMKKNKIENMIKHKINDTASLISRLRIKRKVETMNENKAKRIKI